MTLVRKPLKHAAADQVQGPLPQLSRHQIGLRPENYVPAAQVAKTRQLHGLAIKALEALKAVMAVKPCHWTL